MPVTDGLLQKTSPIHPRTRRRPPAVPSKASPALARDEPESCFAKLAENGSFLPGIHSRATKEVTTFQEMCPWEAAQWERAETQNIPAVREY